MANDPGFGIPPFKLPDFKLPDLTRFNVPKMPEIRPPPQDFFDTLRQFLEDWKKQVPAGQTMSVACSCRHGGPIEVLEFGWTGNFMFAQGINSEGKPAAILSHYANLQFLIQNVTISAEQQERPQIGFLAVRDDRAEPDEEVPMA